MNFDEISQTISQIYTNNLKFFEINYPHIYRQIKEFELQNIENWYIDFIDGRFELCDKFGNTQYNCDPFFDANFRASNINSAPSFCMIKNSLYTSGVTKYYDCINAFEFVNEFIEEPNFQILYKQNSFSKFIFIGTLLGAHLNDIHRVLNSKCYMIIEPNLEIFRLSMFICDYSELSSSKIFFCVGDQDFDASIHSFLEYNFEDNNFIKFELASESEGYLIEKLNLEILNFNQMSFPFSEYLMHVKRGVEYFVDRKLKILKMNSQYKILENYPVLFLGAGPSLAASVEWIYMNQDKFLIVCASAALKRLELLGIIPDIVIVIDAQKKQVARQFEVSPKMYRDSIVLALACIDSDVLNLVEKSKLFLLPSSLEVFEETAALTGITVGDIGIKILLTLGVKKLFILGIDAAIKPDGKTHDGMHASSRKINTSIKKQFHEEINYDNFVFEVDGNLIPKVPSTILYKNLSDAINVTIQEFKNIEIFNLSRFGAKFDGTKPLSFEEFEKKSHRHIDDKYSIVSVIEYELSKIAKTSLSETDVKLVMLEVDFSKKILDFVNNGKFEYEQLKNLIMDNNYFIISQIILNYFRLIGPYFQMLHNHYLLKEQLNKILTQYIDSYSPVLSSNSSSF